MRTLVIMLTCSAALAGCPAEEDDSGATIAVTDTGAPDRTDGASADAPPSADAAPDAADPPPKPDGSAFFEPDRVLQVEIELPPDDWDTLRSQTRTLSDILGGDCLAAPVEKPFTWFAATVTVDGEAYPNVGVRKKGFLGSLSASKPAMKIRFDKFDDDAPLLGGAIKRLTLNNVRQDDSRLNTCMSYQVFAAAGLPTPRCGFAAVSVNGEPLGVYVHIDSIKKDFLARNFGEDEGNLYEGTLSDFRTDWRGTIEKKTNEKENDWSDIDAVIAALETEGPEGLEALGEIVDLDHFLTYWALEVLIGHWDSYSGNRNNYYFYRKADGRFAFIPWGIDSSFAPLRDVFGDEPRPQSVMADGAIAFRLYSDPEWRQTFVERLNTLLETVWDEPALQAEVDRMAAIVQAHALTPTLADAEEDAHRVRSFVASRRAVLAEELESGPVEWPYPLDAADICWEIVGHVDATFATTWGTHGAEDPLSKGSVETTLYDVDNQAVEFGGTGATAGINVDQQGTESAAISLLWVLEGGEAHIMRFFMPPGRVKPGAEVVLDEFTALGIRLVMFPPYVQVSSFHRISAGKVTFDQAGTDADAPVTGHVSGTIFDFGQ